MPHNGKKKSKAMAELAVKTYRKLRSGNAMAKKLGLTHTTAYRLLEKAGIKLPDRHSREVHDRKKKLHGSVARKVAKDYSAGVSMGRLCREYQVGSHAIRTAVRDQGIAERKRGQQPHRLSNTEKNEIERLYTKSGLSQEQIAIKIGCHQTRVSRELLNRGISIRTTNWRGGRRKTGEGYAQVWLREGEPFSQMRGVGGYILEHRLVMAKALNRMLDPNETVHHINGDKSDNRLDNLQLRKGRHGRGMVQRCGDCGSSNIVTKEIG